MSENLFKALTSYNLFNYLKPLELDSIDSLAKILSKGETDNLIDFF